MQRLFRSDLNVLLTLLVAGIATRLLLLLIVDPWSNPLGGDSSYYVRVAGNLWRHGVHAEALNLGLTSFRVPGYPAMLAPLIGVGLSVPAIAAIQSAFTIAVAMATFASLKSYDRHFAILGSLLLAANPFQAIYDLKLLSESLYVGLLLLSWLMLFRWPGLAGAAVAGLLLGLAVLTRDTLLLLGLFAIPFAVLARDPRRAGERFAVLAAISLAVVSPWVVRNHQLTGELSLAQGRLGLNLWVGTWERDGDWVLRGLQRPDFPPHAFRSPEERQAVERAWRTNDDHALRNIAIDRILDEPAVVAGNWAARLPLMWIGTRSDQIDFRAERGSAAWQAVKSILFGLNALVLLLGFGGLIAAIVRRSPLRLFAIPVAYTALVYLPFHNVETRYSLPALPFLLVFGGYALVQARSLLRRRPSSLSPR